MDLSDLHMQSSVQGGGFTLEELVLVKVVDWHPECPNAGVPVIYESSRKNISRKWYPRASSLMFRAFISHLRVPVDGQLSAIRQMIEIILPLQIRMHILLPFVILYTMCFNFTRCAIIIEKKQLCWWLHCYARIIDSSIVFSILSSFSLGGGAGLASW